MKWILYAGLMIIPAFTFTSCESRNDSNSTMTALLSDIYKKGYRPDNPFCTEARLSYYDSIHSEGASTDDIITSEYLMAQTLLELGEEQKAVELSESLLKKIPFSNLMDRDAVTRNLAIAYIRLGERVNCIHDHSAQSCIFPISGRGVHADKTGSEKAIELYKKILANNPTDLESRWLINIAYMTTGGYPDKVPHEFLIEGLDIPDTTCKVAPFIDAAVDLGLNIRNMSGGSIVEDFNNDGYLDIVTSSWNLKEGMHYRKNNGDGSFTDLSQSSGLRAFTGGLNIVQTDYNNDGLKDIFVLRGAWKRSFGKEPNSLLRNNGDNTFTDVTVESGLLSFFPTQTATWADFNNDGWLDVFIGNESTSPDDIIYCEFYISNKNGTFTEISAKNGTHITAFVKGVTSGDYNNDGFTDIFISTQNGSKILLKNEGVKNGMVQFTDVSEQAGLTNNKTSTFPTWFWDYNNDGWLDILVSGYEFSGSLAPFSAAEAMKMTTENSGEIFLFKNNQNGTFEEITDKVGLNRVTFAMGANFGDIDNDGYPDIYMGTGNPLYPSLVPNKMFKNIGGSRFADITTAARVGNLQKGHGVSFADLDNDGDEDIYIDMGGAYIGDAYQSSLYINPGQNNNNWISLSLEGTASNRAAIGTKIKVTFKEKGVTRSVYKDVNSGGSFGSNPLIQHIGIGTATTIESIEIKWPVTQKVQVFKNVQPGETVKIKEGTNSFTKVKLNKHCFIPKREGLVNCYPQ